MTKQTRIIDQNRGEVLPHAVEIINGDGTWNNLQQADENINGLLKAATDAQAKAETNTDQAVMVSNLRQGAPALAAGTLAAMFPQHYQMSPALGTATYVHAAMNLGAAAQDIAAAITHPDFPRIVTIKGGISGQNGHVVITGTNFAGDVITDEIISNGTSEIAGIKAFKTVTNIHLPIETHAHAAQVETATAAGTVTLAGDASVIVTCTGMTGTPKTFAVAVAGNDDASAIAGKIRAVLAVDAAVTALFNVTGATDKIILTRKVVAANITNLNIAIATGTATGVTAAPASENTVPGVAYDTISVGVGNVFGMPHILFNAAALLLKLFDGSTDSGTLAVDADELEKNLFSINGSPDGSRLLDLIYLV